MNFSNILNRKIILASQSPRRSQLLRESGFTNLIIRPTDTDETIPPQYKKPNGGFEAVKVVKYLAEKKATAAKAWIENDEIVLASDTIVVLNDMIYNKPENVEDARRILRDLSGKMHKVITGVCLISKTKKKVFFDTAKVYFDTMSEEEIEFYIHTYQPFDKAGAYAIQEWIGHCKIKKIEGSYSTIMGLPTYKVFKEISKLSDEL
jgi:septum formation protein